MKHHDELNSADKAPVDLTLEVVGGLVSLMLAILLLPRLGASDDVSWLAGTMAILLSLATASLKIHHSKALAKLSRALCNGPGQANTLANRVAFLSGTQAEYAQRVLQRAAAQIESISKGVVPLSEEDYFHRIISEMTSIPDRAVVIAVNAFEPARWLKDPREMLFFQENISAVKRGIRIQRIFIVDSDLPSISMQTAAAIKMHHDVKIEVKIVTLQSLRGKSDLIKDWVAFIGTESRLYVDYQDPADPTRVERGELYLDPTDHNDFLNRFRLLEEHARPSSEALLWLDSVNSASSPRPPAEDDVAGT